MSGGPRPPGRKQGLLPGREPPRPKAGDPPDGALGLITRRTKCQGSIFWACPRLPPLSQRVCDPGKPNGPQRHHPKSHQCWETSDKSLSVSETASSPAPISPLSHAPPPNPSLHLSPFCLQHLESTLPFLIRWFGRETSLLSLRDKNKMSVIRISTYGLK